MQNEPSSLRNFCFTLNNPTLSPDELVTKLSDDARVRYAIFQHERGATGTPHYQGYVELTKQLRFATAKNIINGNPHIEKRRGTQKQAIEYCRKEDSRIDGPWELGTPRKQGARTDLQETMQKILAGTTVEELQEEGDWNAIKYRRSLQDMHQNIVTRKWRNTPRPDLRVTLLWGHPGTGKTRYVYEEHGYENVYTLVTSANGSVWFDGYNGQDVLLIDDYRGFIPFQFFLKILDIYPLRLDVKGSFTYAWWTKVYITSNHAITDWYRSDSNHCTDALRRRIHNTIHYPDPECQPFTVRAGPPEQHDGVVFVDGEQVAGPFIGRKRMRDAEQLVPPETSSERTIPLCESEAILM